MIEQATDWRAAGACRTADPDLFFPVTVGTAAGEQISRALGICAGCPVRQQCFDFAMQTRESVGIWGGTIPEERIRALRARNRRPARRTWRQAPETRAS
jgi:WhiB family transcriptional regulator, redox-sensing transcriptional regulator